MSKQAIYPLFQSDTHSSPFLASNSYTSYKNYPWEKVEKFVKEELKLDLFDKKVFIHRYVDEETKTPIWDIHHQVGLIVYSIEINANTGKIIKQEEGEIEK